MNKRLYRSTKDKMIGGVSGGLAQYFSIDPTIVRVLFVLSLFLGGSGIIAYIILWIVVPEEPYIYNMPSSSSSSHPEGENVNTESPEAKETASKLANEYHEVYEIGKRKKRQTFAGIVLVVLGMIILADNFFPRFDFVDIIPYILVLIGIWLLTSGKQNSIEDTK